MTESATEAPGRSGTPAEGQAPKARRGWASLYALAFLLMLMAAGSLVLEVRGFLASTRLLWISTALSALAIALAILSVVLPRRR